MAGLLKLFNTCLIKEVLDLICQAPRVKRSKLISKSSQQLASRAVNDKGGAINSTSDEERELELMSNDGSCFQSGGGADSTDLEGSCSWDQRGGGGGEADSTEVGASSDDHHQDDSDEETDSDGATGEESDGSHDGAEFTTAAAADDNIDTSTAAVPTCTTGEDGTSARVKKVKIPGLYKPPTHDELQTLRETQNLFKSNLMRLQVHKHGNVQHSR